MPQDFSRETFSPRKLRTTTLCGLVFATLSADAPPIEEYIGADILGRIKRVLNKQIRVMGRYAHDGRSASYSRILTACVRLTGVKIVCETLLICVVASSLGANAPACSSLVPTDSQSGRS